MKKLLFFLFLLPSLTLAELIPADRLIKWVPGVDVGVSGGIRNRTTIVDASEPPYNADKTGANDARAAIQNAINATPANGVTFLPAGTYKISGQLALGSQRTLRGAGMDKTILKLTTSGNHLSFGNN